VTFYSHLWIAAYGVYLSRPNMVRWPTETVANEAAAYADEVVKLETLRRARIFKRLEAMVSTASGTDAP